MFAPQSSSTKETEMISETPTSLNEEGKMDLDHASLLSEAEEKALIRKIDRRLLPLMLFSYMLQFFDKTTLGYAAILGIQQDAHLKGSDYSWVSSTFYFGYLAASYPASIAFVKLPLGKVIAVSILIWAVILTCHGAAMNFTGLVFLRLMLGVFESTISPGFSLLTGMWYKPSEHASRHGIWFAGNSIASIFGGLLAYAIGHIQGSIAAWRWLFIIFGIITIFWGIVLLLFLPDSPLTARFLTPYQQQYANRRPQQEQHSFKTTEWKKAQFIEALVDPKTWFLFVYTICTNIPNGGFTNFNGLIIKGFGFSTLETLLLGMPGAAFALLFVVFGSLVSAKVRNARCLTMATLQVIALAGCLMVHQLPDTHKWSRLGGLWIFAAYPAGLPISLSLIASNVAGYTKKTTVSALLFIAYCAGNIIGPQLFFASEAPTYSSAFTAMIVTFAIAAASIVGMRQYMDWENRRRNSKEQGATCDRDAKKETSTHEHLVQTGLDETDWENTSLRYFL